MMQARVWWLVWAGVLGALALMVLGICVGSAGLENLIGPLLNPAQDPPQTAMAQQIVWQIRLPRTLGAWAAGALLGLAGAVAQGLFRNPLADPYLLGSASGASLGVALALAALGGGAGMLGGVGDQLLCALGHRPLVGVGQHLEPVADRPDRVDQIVAHPRAEHRRKVRRLELDEVGHFPRLSGKNQLDWTLASV